MGIFDRFLKRRKTKGEGRKAKANRGYSVPLEPDDILLVNNGYTIERKVQDAQEGQQDISPNQQSTKNLEGIASISKTEASTNLGELAVKQPTVENKPKNVRITMINEKDIRHIIRGYKWEDTYRYTIEALDIETGESKLPLIDIDPRRWAYHFFNLVSPEEPFVMKNYSEIFTCEITGEQYRAIMKMYQITLHKANALQNACRGLSLFTDPNSKEDIEIREDLPKLLKRNTLRFYRNLVGFVQKICNDSPLYIYEETTDQEIEGIENKSIEAGKERDKDDDIILH